MEEIEYKNLDLERLERIFLPDKENFLKRVSGQIEKYPEAETTLKFLAGVGMISLAFIMPGLGKLVLQELRQKERDRYLKMISRFKKKKWVEIIDSPDGPIVKITEEGRSRALRYKIDEMAIKPQLKWDKLWRIIIFDVAETKRRQRDIFRQYIHKLGFYPLNKSVFVHPYPCFDQVEFLRQLSGVGKEVTYITAQSIESQADLYKHFDIEE